MTVEPAKMGWLDKIVNVNWGARDLLVIQSQASDVLFGTGNFATAATARGTGFMLGAVQVLLGGNILDPTGQFGDAFYSLGTHNFSLFEPTINGVLVFDITALQASIGNSFEVTIDYDASGLGGLDQINCNVDITFHKKVQSIQFSPSQLEPVLVYAKGGGAGNDKGAAFGLFSSPSHHTAVFTADLKTRAIPAIVVS